jgi:hypothetical protein
MDDSTDYATESTNPPLLEEVNLNLCTKNGTDAGTSKPSF